MKKRKAGRRGAQSQVWIAITALVLGSSPAWAADIFWDVQSGVWSDPAHWSPQDVPDIDDAALIGASLSAANGVVTLDQADTVGELEVTDGMLLNLNSYRLRVAGPTLISGQNVVGNVLYSSRLWVFESASAAADFNPDSLTVEDNGELRLQTNAHVKVEDVLNIRDTGKLLGIGLLQIAGNSGSSLSNDGIIAPGNAVLTLEQLGDGLLDLDGNFATGEILLTSITFDQSEASRLTVIGTELGDSFSSHLRMINKTELNMLLDNPWEADAASQLLFLGGTTTAAPALVKGAPVTLAGEVKLGNGAWAKFDTETTFEQTVEVDSALNCRLELMDITDIQGGTFTAGDDSRLLFRGPTSVSGGSFATPSNQAADGYIAFEGATDWKGPITLDGIIRQNGEATVVLPTTVDGGVFDLDGTAGLNALWNINATLTLNVTDIEDAGSAYDGELNIAGGITSRLEVNLPSPVLRWQLDGVANLAGNVLFYVTRLSGSPMVVDGKINLPSNRANVDAPVRFRAGSQVLLPAASSELRFTQETIFDLGSSVFGDGGILNAASGDMSMPEGTTPASIRLQNDGVFTTKPGVGLLALDGLTTGANSTTIFEITDQGGPLDGSRMTVLGPATLNGTLKVSFPNGIPSIPENTAFTLISSDNRVGEFDQADLPLGYRWELTYPGNDVVLTALGRTGDMNCDGVVDFFDIDPFVQALVNPAQYVLDYPACDISNGDINDDGVMDFFDIDPFVTLLVGP